MIKQYSWREFLRQVSSRLIEIADEYYLEIFEEDYKEFITNKWFGYPGATQAQISKAESRLGIHLPPDYKQFLFTTNGWRAFYQYPYGLVSLLPIEEVDWFARKDKRIGRLEGWIDLQRSHRLEKDEHVIEEHFRATLMIGESDGNECLLLNPLVKTSYKEWEAWTYHPENGIDRLPSFWNLMQECAIWYVLNDR